VDYVRDSSPTYAFLVTATVMVHVDAGHEAAAIDQLNAALAGERGLPNAANVAGMRLTAITLGTVDGLDQIGGVPLDELCRNEECREPLNGDS